MSLNEAPPAPADTGQVPAGGTRAGAARLAALVAVVTFVGLRGGLPWLFVIGSIVVMIFLHELGHFVTAKWAGMKVTQFFLGFGPRIWSVQRGETEYGIKAIPAGAYVKVVGMYDIDEVDPGDEPRTYRQKKYHQRVVMAAAGSTMHFLLAIALIFSVFVGFGRQKIDHWQIATVSPASAAADGGLLPGDRLVSVDGLAVGDWSSMHDVIAPRLGRSVPVVFERGGRTGSVEVTLGANPDRPDEGLLGVSPEFPRVRSSVVAAVPDTLGEFATVTSLSVRGMVELFTPSALADFAQQVAQGRPTDTAGSEPTDATSGDNRFLSIYGAARLGVDLTREGIAPALAFLAMLNIFIGLFNLAPLLPFDGGHIAIATYERVRELIARDGRRHFTDVSRLLPLTYAVVGLLAVIGLSSFYLDFVNPVSLP